MIYGVFIINDSGKPRLMKFYEQTPVDKQQHIVRETYQTISRRSDRNCNFVENVGFWAKDTKLVYKKYATLFFIFAVDASESELGIIDLIQVFVEALDTYFESVSELEVIFHPDKVHYVLDEIIMGGLVLETDKSLLIDTISKQTAEAADPSLKSELADAFKTLRR
eukprot:TRINITY_DN24253_c0_g1_i1.p2 TRINITY_DN24253_c0_g1~~TRINITY_DN24253_c0_g1_i1.p2  ORF type:complete len:166 (+),score=41.84 TRINITY_DN24253_c0_g1_i1:948-1445(+)